MKLSEHFTLQEMLKSMTAVRYGIDNTPSTNHVANLRALAVNVLEPVRELMGNRPIIITSGYRCPLLNRMIGGSKSSQHMKGQAADFEIPELRNRNVIEAVAASDIPFDQLIYEFGEQGWIHISHDGDGIHQRREVLAALHSDSGTRYIPWTSMRQTTKRDR